VPGEQSAPTQPIPTLPPPLARVSYATADLVTARDTTAEHAAFCRALRDRSGGLQNSGPFTPYRYRAEGAEPRSTIVFPGSIGAATWGGVAADPSRGLVFVNTNSEGGIGWIERNSGDAVSAQTGGARNERLPYRRTSAVGGPLARFWWRDATADSAGNEQNGDAAAWPCQKPPWGELAAVDVACFARLDAGESFVVSLHPIGPERPTRVALYKRGAKIELMISHPAGVPHLLVVRLRRVA